MRGSAHRPACRSRLEVCTERCAASTRAPSAEIERAEFGQRNPVSASALKGGRRVSNRPCRRSCRRRGRSRPPGGHPVRRIVRVVTPHNPARPSIVPRREASSSRRIFHCRTTSALRGMCAPCVVLILPERTSSLSPGFLLPAGATVSGWGAAGSSPYRAVCVGWSSCGHDRRPKQSVRRASQAGRVPRREDCATWWPDHGLTSIIQMLPVRSPMLSTSLSRPRRSRTGQVHVHRRAARTVEW